jgi:hypothetical protein
MEMPLLCDIHDRMDAGDRLMPGAVTGKLQAPWEAWMPVPRYRNKYVLA